MRAEPADLGYVAEERARYGIVYEAFAGGAGFGMYVVVDRILGFKTAWRIHVDPRDSERMTQGRLDRLRELVGGENERWRGMTEAEQAIVRRGGRDSEGRWGGVPQDEKGATA